MSDKTSIQWADSTVNPIMGCGGCELFPPPAKILLAINKAVAATGHKISSRSIYEELVESAHGAIDHPLEGHKNVVNTTNIWHLRSRFLMRVLDETKTDIAAHDAAERVIKESITCYAALLHLNKGRNILKDNYGGHPGYAPIFESVTEFPGRAEKTANLKDLLGCSEGRSPWKMNLPRLIFVSDMGDAMSGQGQFPFLKNDLIPAITSDTGKRHLWLWLTKRPSQLAKFAEQIGGLPGNVCAMTTLTSVNGENLKRLADIKKVQAPMRGLSIEPLWERIDPKKLDLKGIDWVIVGGESGSGELTRPFALEWAEELRDYCRKKRVAFFLKQLGRKPTRNGEPLSLKDSHGGDWDEWPDEELKVREFPKAFHNYRKNEIVKPMKSPKKPVKKIEEPDLPITEDDKAEFDRLDQIVKKGVKWYIEAGLALREIHQKKLWRAGGYKRWDDYCETVVGKTRAHAQRLMEASAYVLDLAGQFDKTLLPQNEAQARPLSRLKDPDDRRAVWEALVLMIEDGAANPKITADTVRGMVEELLEILADANGTELPKKKLPSKAERKRQAISNLRSAVAERKSWEEVEKLLDDLEKLI